MTTVKSQLCSVGFAAEVKTGFRGDIAALYFTLSKVMDAYLAVEMAQYCLHLKFIAVYCLLLSSLSCF